MPASTSPVPFSMAQLAEQMRRVSHFQHLPDASLLEIVSMGQMQRAGADSPLFIEAEPCAGLFILLTGRVHLIKLSPEGQEGILAAVDPVIMFNEVAVLDGGPNPVTALAVENCLIWHCQREQFLDLLTRYPGTALGLLRVLAARNRRLVGQFEDLAFRSVLGRSARLLLELSHDGVQTLDRNRHPNTELASRIATVPEAFSRALKALRRSGAIEVTRSAIVVHQPDQLRHIALIGPDLLP